MCSCADHETVSLEPSPEEQLPRAGPSVVKDTLAKQHEKRNICSMEGGERVHQL